MVHTWIDAFLMLNNGLILESLKQSFSSGALLNRFIDDVCLQNFVDGSTIIKCRWLESYETTIGITKLGVVDQEVEI